MTKRNYKYYSYVKTVMNYINRAVDKGLSLKKISDQIRDLVNSYSGLNRNERFALYQSAYGVARAATAVKRSGGNWQKTLSLRKNYDQILRSSRKVGQAVKRKIKLKSIRAMLINDDPGHSIFFMCSAHTGCAEDHKPYQKQIFVNRFWRSKASGKDYRAISYYIKNHNTITVQDVMKEPAYLFTRPNCRHYLIPLPTVAVLRTSQKKIVQEYLPPHHKKLYTAEDYYHLREEVYESMNKDTPCKEYQNKTKTR